MFDIGFAELMVVGFLGLIILGPERLPKAARTVGLLLGRVRRTMSGIQQEIEQEVKNQELQEKLEDPMHSYLNDDELSAEQVAEKELLALTEAKAKLKTAQDSSPSNKTDSIGDNSIAPSTHADSKVD